nr:MAG TPA: hypothetical protein [Caudoviricetes sp.]
MISLKICCFSKFVIITGFSRYKFDQKLIPLETIGFARISYWYQAAQAITISRALKGISPTSFIS